MRIVKSKPAALRLAKQLLRIELRRYRITNPHVENTSCQCACGETAAIKLHGQTNITGQIEDHKHVIVGICKICGE